MGTRKLGMAALSYDAVKAAALACVREAASLELDQAKAQVEEALLSKLEFRKDDADPKLVAEQRFAVDHSLSTLLEELCDSADAKGEVVQNVGVNTFLDLSLFMASEGVTDKVSPFSLLESLFESQTISGCERAF